MEKKETKKLNLHQKLIEIRKQVPYIQKNSKGFNFEYVSGSILLGLLRPKMDELGILLSYSIDELITDDVERLVKNKMVQTGRTKLKYVFTFTNADKPEETISQTLWTQGIGDDIQSAGSFSTYTIRYFLLGFFQIPTDKDDPDAFENSRNSMQPKELISQEQAENINKSINGYESIRYRINKSYGTISKIPVEHYGTVLKHIERLILDEEKK